MILAHMMLITYIVFYIVIITQDSILLLKHVANMKYSYQDENQLTCVVVKTPSYEVTNTLFNQKVNYVIYDGTLYSDVVNIQNINHVTQSQPYYISKNMSSHTMNLVTLFQ